MRIQAVPLLFVVGALAIAVPARRAHAKDGPGRKAIDYVARFGPRSE